MIIAEYLLVSLLNKQICVVVESTNEVCFPVSIGCVNTPTPKGTYTIDEILIRPRPISPINGNIYPSTFLGSMVIPIYPTNGNGARTKDSGLGREHPASIGTTLAIHGWHDASTIGKDCSMGCIRLTNTDIDKLIFDYMFNQVIIQD